MALLPCSLQPVFYQGLPVPDAQVQAYLANTTTPASIFLDPDYATAAPNPCPVNEFGVFPPLYAQGALRLRFEDPTGFPYNEIARVTLVDPVAMDDGAETVGDTSRAQTGDIKQRFGTGAHPGWVPMRGRSLGSVASGATERANADARDLFIHMWNADPTLPVTGGRGADAAADWSQDKQLTLPNMAGRGLKGLEEIGGAMFEGARFDAGGSRSRLGSTGGDAVRTLTEGNLPAHGHLADITIFPNGEHVHPVTIGDAPPHNHPFEYTTTLVAAGSGATVLDSVTADAPNGVPTGTQNAFPHSHSATMQPAGQHAHVASATIRSTGGGQAFSLLDPFLLVTFYLKL